MDGKFLPEADWRDLLREIHNHQVIPIVGPEMVTVREPSTGISIPLYRALAPKLAAALAVPTNGAPATSLNRVACDHLLSGGARKAIYGEVAELLDRMELTPPQALCELASITDFDLFISGTIDPLLAVALEGARPGFQRREHVRAYDYKRRSNDYWKMCSSARFLVDNILRVFVLPNSEKHRLAKLLVPRPL